MVRPLFLRIVSEPFFPLLRILEGQKSGFPFESRGTRFHRRYRCRSPPPPPPPEILVDERAINSKTELAFIALSLLFPPFLRFLLSFFLFFFLLLSLSLSLSLSLFRFLSFFLFSSLRA